MIAGTNRREKQMKDTGFFRLCVENVKALFVFPCIDFVIEGALHKSVLFN